MKTREDVLNQDYLTSSDIKILMPTLSITKCLNLINEVREEMKEKNLYVPVSKPRLALKKIVVKKLGI